MTLLGEKIIHKNVLTNRIFMIRPYFYKISENIVKYVKQFSIIKYVKLFSIIIHRQKYELA